MKTINHIGAQGDVCFTVGTEPLPAGAVRIAPIGPAHIVAHSETGHHHIVDGRRGEFYRHPTDPFKFYFVPSDAAPVDVEHTREDHRHETVRIEANGAVIVIHRQRNPATRMMVQD